MKRTLIYIIGAGRSGTTILDIVLGNNRDTLSLGEINRFFKRNGIPPKRAKEDEVSIFWKKIKDDFKKRRLSQIGNCNFEKESKSTYKNEYHSFFLKSILNLNSQEYQDSLNVLQNIIFQSTTETTLIDSSKYPLRALNLSRLKMLNVEIKFIYIKKDPVKVVKSFGKKDLEQPSKGFFASNLYYLIVNLLCEIVLIILKLKKFKVSKIKYKDLILDSSHTLDKLSIELSENFEFSKKLIENNEPLKTGYLFDGNRIRLKETIFLQENIVKEKKNVKYYFTRMLNYLIYN